MSFEAGLLQTQSFGNVRGSAAVVRVGVAELSEQHHRAAAPPAAAAVRHDGRGLVGREAHACRSQLRLKIKGPRRRCFEM